MRRGWSVEAVRVFAGVVLAICAAATAPTIWLAVSESARSHEADGVVTGHVEVKRSLHPTVDFRLSDGELRTARVDPSAEERKVGERFKIRYVVDDRRQVTNVWFADSFPNAGLISFLSLLTLGCVVYNAYAWWFNPDLDTR